MRARLILLAGAAAVVGAVLPGRAASPASPRQIAPDAIAPPQFDPKRLEREAPRAPLSEIGPAGPAKPRKPKEPDGNKLFNPLATAAGVVEVKGLTVTVAGIDVVGADETCSANGKDWPCGVRARSAFRGLLRGRAVACDLPPGTVDGPVSVPCRIGKQDIGAWLVANGWARAASGGPYADVGEKARAAAKGIFGRPPDLNGLPAEPAPYAAAAANQPILEPSESAPQAASPQDAAPVAPTPPAPPQGLY